MINKKIKLLAILVMVLVIGGAPTMAAQAQLILGFSYWNRRLQAL